MIRGRFVSCLYNLRQQNPPNVGGRENRKGGK